MWKKLINWSKNEFKDLPWRQRRTLYRTFVSEIMLQQTTVSTVLNHFEKFLKQYPNLTLLSQSTEEEMLVAWKGLGYYRRAKNLRLAAIELAQNYGGRFPKTYEELTSIQGIGPYTASALLSIGRDERFLAIDANLERVLSRFYAIEGEKGPKHQKKISKLFEDKKILSKGEAKSLSFRELNEALMDLGRTFCQSRRASCELCPLEKSCQARALGKAMSFGVSQKVKKKDAYELSLLRLIVGDKKNGLMGVKREEGQWLAGQYELPTFILSSEDESLNQYPVLKKDLKLKKNMATFKTTITKYKITNYVYFTDHEGLKTLMGRRELKKLEKLPLQKWSRFSTASHKALKISGT